MNIRSLLLAGAAALISLPAAALVEPHACSAGEPRVRCVDYNPAEVVLLYAATGATLTVNFGDGETITNASLSDSSLLEGGGPSARTIEASSQGSPTTTDQNLQMARQGGFLFLKPLRSLVPQPVTVLTTRADGKVRAYTFQLQTRPGDLGPQTPNTYFLVRFNYPADLAAERRARAEADREARAARLAAARLTQQPVSGATPRNTAYRGTATSADRQAIAPSAMWDDGNRTFLRYPGNSRIPQVYQVSADGQETLTGFSVEADPTSRGTLVVLHGVHKDLRLREGGAVVCIQNLAYDPVGRPTGTATTSPDVIRELRPAAQRGASHVRR